MAAVAYLGLGSNLGDRRGYIARALRMLGESGRVRVERVSSLYETDPVGYTEQGRFLNAVAAVSCDLPPTELLRLCQAVEASLGRERVRRWGPRTIDIDILLYFCDFAGRGLTGPARSVTVQSPQSPPSSPSSTPPAPGGDDEGLQIPHPRMWERGFVIVPLAELAPDLTGPDGRSAAELARDPRMREGVLLRMAGPWWLKESSTTQQMAFAQAACRAAGGRTRPADPTGPVGLCWDVLRFAEVDSTNEVAKRMADAGAPEGTCVVAEVQTAGRGRMGRVWHSPKGGMWLSTVLRPALPPRDAGKLSLVTGVAVTQAVREVAGLPAMMKWPNDVVLHGRKVGGILVESKWTGETLDYIVDGIGVNVAVDVAALPPEARCIAGTLVPPSDPEGASLRERLLEAILDKLGLFYRQFLSAGFLGILEKARVYCDTLGREVEATCPGGGLLRGTAVAIDADGALVIKTPSGDVRLVSGDVTVRGAGGSYSSRARQFDA